MVDFVGCAEDHGGSLVQTLRDDVEDAMATSNGATSSLFDDHGHRVGFIEQSQFSLCPIICGWVEKDTTLEQCPMNVGHHGSDVSTGVV